MKLLFDQNLSKRLSSRLQDQFAGSLHVREALTRRATDESVWFYARDNEFVVVTKDSDYRRLSIERGYPPKVIWIRSGNSSADLIESLLRDNYDRILAFERAPNRGIIELG